MSEFTEIEIPSLGMDTDTVPRLLSRRKASLIKNFLMDRPGVLPMRGPLCEGVTWDAGASMGLLGAWSFDDKLLVSRYAASATATRDPWVAPYRLTGDVNVLRDGDLTLKHIDLTTGTVTNVAVSDADGVLGPKFVRVGNSVYGPGADAVTTSPGSPGTIFKLPQLLRWDGGTAEPTQYGAAAPVGLRDITYHYNRLFAIGDVSSNGNRLYWTDPLPSDGTTLPVSINAWQDDVTGLTNMIVVGSADGSDFCVALARVGPNLLILKRRSLWMLYGTSPANFVVKRLADVGCLDPRSVVEYAGGAYFMSERGFMFFDGASARSVSTGVESTLVAQALKQVGPAGVDGGYARAAILDRGYILVTTGRVAGATLTATADSDAWLLHAPSGAWLQLSSGALSTVLAGGRSVNNTYLMTDTKLVKANYLFNPEGAPAGTRGVDSIDGGTNQFVIPSRWITRALTLGAPLRESKLERLVAEYYWSLSNGGWQVVANVRGPQGVLTPGGTFPSPTGISGSLPARGGIDIFHETDEVFLDIQAAVTAAGTFDRAELHRLGVLSTPAQRSRSAS